MSRISNFKPIQSPRFEIGAPAPEGPKLVDVEIAARKPATAEQAQWVIDAGTSRDSERIKAVPDNILIATLRGSDPIAQNFAIKEIRERRLSTAVTALCDAMDRGVNMTSVAGALEKIGAPDALPSIPALLRSLDRPGKTDPLAVINALKAFGGPQGSGQLAILATSMDPQLSEMALAAIANKPEWAEWTVPVLREAMQTITLDTGRTKAYRNALNALGWDADRNTRTSNSQLSPRKEDESFEVSPEAGVSTSDFRNRFWAGVKRIQDYLTSFVDRSDKKYAPHGLTILELGTFRGMVGKAIELKLKEHQPISGDYGGVYLRSTGRNKFEAVHILGTLPVPHSEIAEWTTLNSEARLEAGYWNSDPSVTFRSLGLREFFTPPKPPLTQEERKRLESDIGKDVEILTVEGHKKVAELRALQEVRGALYLVIGDNYEREMVAYNSISKLSAYW